MLGDQQRGFVTRIVGMLERSEVMPQRDGPTLVWGYGFSAKSEGWARQALGGARQSTGRRCRSRAPAA